MGRRKSKLAKPLVNGQNANHFGGEMKNVERNQGIPSK
ncbi:hypothetical protein CSB80_0002 [Staphylococcus aureus]|nr:hypothetical protein CSB80_0002 [Staphylococcus aureus]